MPSEKSRLVIEVAQATRRFQTATDLVDEAAVRQLGINRTDATCIDLIGQHGRLTPTELAGHTGLTTGAVTGIVDRLERAGLVSRVRDESDRRKVFVEMTDAARERTAGIYLPIGEAAVELLARYTAGELRVIRRYLEEGIEFQQDQAERIRSLEPPAPR